MPPPAPPPPSAWFRSYTSCSQPSEWGPPIIASKAKLLGWIFGLVVSGAIVGLLAGAVVPGVGAAISVALLAAINFCSWWLETRLVCLGGDRSAVGVIYAEDAQHDDLFDLEDYDTDFSFNLLMWPFVPKNELPANVASNPWSATTASELATEWHGLSAAPLSLVPDVPYAEVEDQVELILPQQSMATLDLAFTGQNVEQDDEPTPQPTEGSHQHFLIHCEIEGGGMYDLRETLYWVLGLIVVTTVLSAIPGVGWLLSAILAALAILLMFLGAYSAQNDKASAPPDGPDGQWGGIMHPYVAHEKFVDIGYAYGRWVYDSFHNYTSSPPGGWNELHPLHFILKIGEAPRGRIAEGNWPTDLGERRAKYDAQFAEITAPGSAALQAEPQNQWTLHPLLDGCQAGGGYPMPPPRET
jgi:hypothetical protein